MATSTPRKQTTLELKVFKDENERNTDSSKCTTSDSPMKPELKKTKSSPIGKDLETYMHEMGLSDNENNVDDDDEQEDETDEEKYAASNFEPSDQKNESANQMEHPKNLSFLSASSEEKVKQLARLGYSPRTIEAATTTKKSPQKSASSSEQSSPDTSTAEKKESSLVYSSSDGLLSSKQSKKHVAWSSTGNYC